MRERLASRRAFLDSIEAARLQTTAEARMTQFRLQVISSPGKGRGLFAGEFIPAQTLIDAAPATELDPEISRLIIERGSGDLFLSWREVDAKVVTLAFAAGILMICNHDSERPNAQLRKNHPDRTAELWSTSDIESGEEILISYRKYQV